MTGRYLYKYGHLFSCRVKTDDLIHVLFPCLVLVLVGFTLMNYVAYGDANNLTVNVSTPTSLYYAGETIIFTGNVFNALDGEAVKSSLSINVIEQENKQNIYQSNAVTDSDGSFKGSFVADGNGTFNIVVKAIKSNLTASASKTIKVERSLFTFNELLKSPTPVFMYCVYIAIGSGILVTILSTFKWKSHTRNWFDIGYPRGRLFIMIAFMFLSSLVFAPLLFLLFNHIPLGGGILSISRSFGPDELWWTNIAGLKVPLSIIVFSILGAYIRYLWNLYSKMSETAGANKIDSTETSNSSTPSSPTLVSATDSLYSYRLLWQAITLFFLAPLLAIILYFILVLAGTTEQITFALSAIAIGLTAENAIKFIIKNRNDFYSGQNDNSANPDSAAPSSAAPSSAAPSSAAPPYGKVGEV